MPARLMSSAEMQKSSQSPRRDSQQTTPEASLGRPRSHESERAILEATWQLLLEKGVRKTTIEGIARAAGVGKTTIYRWWPSKAAVFVDAFLARVETALPFPEAATAREALSAQMEQLVGVFRGDVGRIVAEGQSDPEALASFRDRFLNLRRDVARQIIARGIDSGEFDAALDPDLAMDILYGPIYYRSLVRHLPLDTEFATALPRRAMSCLLPPGSSA